MATLTKDAACKMCVYWKTTTPDRGECRRHAPQTIVFKVDDQMKYEYKFPVTAGDDWCGDFERKK
jgi:hypothetical protein